MKQNEIQEGFFIAANCSRVAQIKKQLKQSYQEHAIESTGLL